MRFPSVVCPSAKIYKNCIFYSVIIILHLLGCDTDSNIKTPAYKYIYIYILTVDLSFSKCIYVQYEMCKICLTKFSFTKCNRYAVVFYFRQNSLLINVRMVHGMMPISSIMNLPIYHFMHISYG